MNVYSFELFIYWNDYFIRRHTNTNIGVDRLLISLLCTMPFAADMLVFGV